jgi:ribosomal protein S18 acetylase RimI-like enzyme
MYVAPQYRRRGLATKLLEACLAQARAFPEVEEVSLAVTVGNEAARQTYVKFGFQPEYVEPRYFKHGGRYYDMEWMHIPLR